jgi:hypothetical protein
MGKIRVLCVYNKFSNITHNDKPYSIIVGIRDVRGLERMYEVCKYL